MLIPTEQQINKWLRFKYGEDTGLCAYVQRNDPDYPPTICSIDHGWVRCLLPSEIRSVMIWNIDPRKE